MFLVGIIAAGKPRSDLPEANASARQRSSVDTDTLSSRETASMFTLSGGNYLDMGGRASSMNSTPSRVAIDAASCTCKPAALVY